VELDSVSSNETDCFMQSLSKIGAINRYYRLISDLPLSDSKLEKLAPKRRLKESSIIRQSKFNRSRENCAHHLVKIKRERERTTRWAAFAGPLCYSQEQLSAECSAPSFSGSSGSFKGVQRDGIAAPSPKRNIIEKREMGNRHAIRYTLLAQRFSMEELLSNSLFKGISSNAAVFLWRVPEFYEGFVAKGKDKPRRIENVITVNRILEDKYWTCTCKTFIHSLWSGHGESVLQLVEWICQVLTGCPDFQEDNIECGDFKVNARATRDILVIDPSTGNPPPEDVNKSRWALLLDSLRWLICALMPSDEKEGIFCTYMESFSGSQAHVIAYKRFDPSQQNQSYCWNTASHWDIKEKTLFPHSLLLIAHLLSCL